MGGSGLGRELSRKCQCFWLNSNVRVVFDNDE
jgi:hypothetical protein